VIKIRGVVDDLNSGRRTLVEALQAVEDEFPVEEYRAFIGAIALSIEQGSPPVTTLGDMSNGLQSEIKNELLGQGLRTAAPMVLGMGINTLSRRPRRVWAGVAGKEPLRTPRRSVVGCGDILGWRSSMKNYE